MSTVDRQLKEQMAKALLEKQRRSQLAINKYIPNDKDEHNQLAFHTSNRFITIGTGGNQSGKSIMAAAEAAWALTGTHPYNEAANRKPPRIWCLSSEYRTIFEGVYRHLRPDGADYNGMGFLPEHLIKRRGPKMPQTDVPSFFEVKWKDGRTSRIDFISAEGGESARKRVQGAAIDFLFIDEEIDGNIWQELLVRTLATNGRIFITATMLVSPDWLLDLEDRANENDPDILFIRLNTNKNQYISSSQIEKVFASMSEEEREIRMFGKSRRDHGLVYPEFTHEHVVEPFDITEEHTKNCKFYCALDPGFRTFAALWIMAVSESEMYVIDEMYLTNPKLTDVREHIDIVESHQFIESKRVPIANKPSFMPTRLIDPASKRNLETGEPGVLSQLMIQHDMPCIPAFNTLQAGVESVHRLFSVDPITNKPILRVFRTCKNFLNERRSYRIKPDKSTKFGNAPSDNPIKKKDHLMDCLRYISIHILQNEFPEKELASHGFSQTPVTLREQIRQSIENIRQRKNVHFILGSEN